MLRRLSFGDPLRWLALGWRDFRRAPGLGLFYGLCFVLMGWSLLKAFEQAPAYVLGLSGGFLLTGPALCLGMYRTSQRLENGEQVDWGDSLLAWQTRTGQLAIFGFVLLVLEMVWARATLVVFAVTFDGMPDFKGSLLALLDPENITFIIAWVVLGALFATLIFAVSVVSIPMLLHRPTDAITAGLTSMRLVLTQTAGDAVVGLPDRAAGGAGHAARLCRAAGGGPGARACVMACLPGGGGRLTRAVIRTPRGRRARPDPAAEQRGIVV